MRISDWSSDVCSSDLLTKGGIEAGAFRHWLLPESWRLRIGIGVKGRLRKAIAARPETGAAHLVRISFARYPVWKAGHAARRSEEHTSELQSLMRISYAVFCLKKKKQHIKTAPIITQIHTDYLLT